MNWEELDGKLCTEIKCNDFKEALLLFNEIAKVAEKYNHHPDIRIHSYRFLSIELFTHDTNSITEKDHELKKAIDLCWTKNRA
jgi:4a-hydroxytetrahydrobiopterin dehydratase